MIVSTRPQRRPWRERSVEERQRALEELRRRQQAQIESELRELVLVRRSLVRGS